MKLQHEPDLDSVLYRKGHEVAGAFRAAVPSFSNTRNLMTLLSTELQTINQRALDKAFDQAKVNYDTYYNDS